MIDQAHDLTIDDVRSSVSWGAVLAGGIASAALTLVLLAFGAGVGFSVVSPWADQGLSSTTFSISAGIYLIAMAMIASTIGGYLAGRLRAKWAAVHEHERYFRDTAHGFLTWAFATLLSVTILSAAITHITSAASAGLSAAAGSTASSDKYVDLLLRTDPAAPPATAGNDRTAARAELSRLVLPSFTKNGALAADDRTYAAHVVAARTGLSLSDAEKRVDQVTTEANPLRSFRCGWWLRCWPARWRRALAQSKAARCEIASGI
jgi:hypothetical protein